MSCVVLSAGETSKNYIKVEWKLLSSKVRCNTSVESMKRSRRIGVWRLVVTVEEWLKAWQMIVVVKSAEVVSTSRTVLYTSVTNKSEALSTNMNFRAFHKS